MCFFFFNRITDFPPPLQGLELSRCRLLPGVADCSVELGRSKVDKVVDKVGKMVDMVDKVVDEEVKSRVEPRLRQSWELEGEEEGDWRGVDPEVSEWNEAARLCILRLWVSFEFIRASRVT